MNKLMDYKELRKLEYQHLETLKQVIIGSFEDYGLHFDEWGPGFEDPEGSIEVYKSPNNVYTDGGINIIGISSEIMSEMQESDYEIIHKFIYETVWNYIKNNEENFAWRCSWSCIDVSNSEDQLGYPGLWILVNIQMQYKGQ